MAGILYDIRVHSSLMNYELFFKKEEDCVNFQVGEKSFSIPCKSISLEEFSKKNGDIILMKVHKSEGYKDFNEELQASKK